MLRNGASRLALRSIGAPASRPATGFRNAAPNAQWATQFGSLASRRPRLAQVAAMKPIQSAIMRQQVTDAQKQAESRYAKEELKPSPETVSATSSTHAFFQEVGDKDSETNKKATGGAGGFSQLNHDVATVKDTFRLDDVPREAYYMGLAGTIPYLATSITTVFCAWQINHSTAGYGIVLSEKSATQLLHFLEPLQIGYGASILSFLGAIHWGLEWAGYGGYQGYKRYAIGVVAPMVAWSTILMPIEGALITQFMGFVALYYVDIRAATVGWVPNWYRTYRFVLTLIVGASIVLTLIGRGELPDHIPRPADRAAVFKMGSEDSKERLSHDEEARAKKEQKKMKAATDDRAGEQKESKKRPEAGPSGGKGEDGKEDEGSGEKEDKSGEEKDDKDDKDSDKKEDKSS